MWDLNAVMPTLSKYSMLLIDLLQLGFQSSSVNWALQCNCNFLALFNCAYIRNNWLKACSNFVPINELFYS